MKRTAGNAILRTKHSEFHDETDDRYCASAYEIYRVPRTSPKVQFRAWSSQFCTKCWFLHTPGNYSPIPLSPWQTSDHSLLALFTHWKLIAVLMCGQFDVLGKNTIHNSLSSLNHPDIDNRTNFLPGWRPKVADVDVNNHPVPGSLIPSNDLVQHTEM
jgi:hypothetical protein